MPERFGVYCCLPNSFTAPGTDLLLFHCSCFCTGSSVAGVVFHRVRYVCIRIYRNVFRFCFAAAQTGEHKDSPGYAQLVHTGRKGWYNLSFTLTDFA